MNKQNKKFNRKKSFEKSWTNSKAEEYNELNEKYNDDHQQQTWSSRKICELNDRSLEIIQSEEEKTKKKNEKKFIPISRKRRSKQK